MQASLSGSLPPEASAEAVAEYPTILASFQRESLAKLEQLIKPFLGELADYLFDLSTQVRHSSSDQNILLVDDSAPILPPLFKRQAVW